MSIMFHVFALCIVTVPISEPTPVDPTSNLHFTVNGVPAAVQNNSAPKTTITLSINKQLLEGNRNLTFKIYHHKKLPFEDICGKPVLTPLIVGGKTVRSGEYPWAVALHHVVNAEKKFEYKCGASLITDRHVVTAAHCVIDKVEIPEHVVMLIGTSNIKLSYYKVDPSKGIVDGKEIYVHPKYRYKAVGDIAVVLLSQPINFTSFIRPICLWRGPKSNIEEVIGSRGRVVGWGLDDNGNINLETASSTDLPIVDKEMCINKQLFELIREDTFCAGDRNGKGPCNGDSGSGLTLLRDNTWYLRGVVSLSISQTNVCNLSNYVILVDAAMHKEWITNIIK